MSYYYKNTPFFLRWIYSKAIWRKETTEKVLYLTFDDGPNNGVTPFVLDVLKKYNARATFFCLGFNAMMNPHLIEEIQKENHIIGNHSYSHFNGFRTKKNIYLEDVEKANDILKSNIFRPPYGKMKLKQYNRLKEIYSIIMWDVMSGDFDVNIDGDKCFDNVVKYARSGSIIVFHDSRQAFDRLKIALPKVLEYYSKLGYRFENLT